jgi:hypothetical protein
MSENWEAALQKAKGEYITVLEDKQAYYGFALAHIEQALRTFGVKVVVWEWDRYDDVQRKAFARRRKARRFLKTTHDILQSYVTEPATAGAFLPRMLNSCAPRSVVEAIETKPKVSRFFAEYSPDLCAAFYTLAVIDQLAVLDEGLGLVGYNHLSNAVRGRLANEEAFAYYGALKTEALRLDSVPVKSFRLTYNTVYNDYLRIRQEAGGNLVPYKMDLAAYMAVCLWDIIRLLNSGAGLAAVRAETVSLFGAVPGLGWRDRLKLFSFVGFLTRMASTKIVDRFRAMSWSADDIYAAAITRPVNRD